MQPFKAADPVKQHTPTVECVVTLRITYDPNMDDDADIKSRVEGEINTMLSRGHLEGCEHGAQIVSHKYDIAISRIE